MMLLKKKIVRFSVQAIVLMVAVLAPISQSLAAKNSRTFVNDDDRFMALRDAALHDDADAAQHHAASLSQYEIPSYVDYYLLRTRIIFASATEVNAFLAKYEGTAIADRLRNDWLLV